MELRHLRYFVAVAEEQHFTRAAERLGMQQPPLSLQIRALEAELGFALFVRHPKGASLTAGGAVFFEEAQAILAGIDAAAARAARAASGATGQLAIGLTSSAAAHGLIPAVMRRYRAAYPAVQIDFSERNAAELGEALAERRLHAAFLRLPVQELPEVQYTPLLMEPMLLALPTGHRAIVRDERHKRGAPRAVALSALAGETLILVRRRGAPGMYANLMAACAAAGVAPGRVIEVERMLTNISLVAAGAGVSAVPASMQGFHADSVVYCPMADGSLAAPLTMGVRHDEGSPALRHFIDTVHAVLAEWAG
jgi:DNA-binding transcriptional LysR family regulator